MKRNLGKIEFSRLDTEWEIWKQVIVTPDATLNCKLLKKTKQKKKTTTTKQNKKTTNLFSYKGVKLCFNMDTEVYFN